MTLGQVPLHVLTFGPRVPSRRSTTSVNMSPAEFSTRTFSAKRSARSVCSMSRICRGVAGPDATASTENALVLTQSGPPVTRIDVLNPPLCT